MDILYIVLAFIVGLIVGFLLSEYINRQAMISMGILTGKDAERFQRRMDEVDQGLHRISQEEYDRSKAAFDKIKLVED